MLHQRLFDNATQGPSNPVARPRDLDPIRIVDEAVRSVLGLTRSRVLSDETGDVVFAERLFSLRHAEALGPRAREVRVAPGTVITPLAQHELKQRGIVVRFASKSELIRAKRKGEWAFAVESESGVVSALRRSLLDDSESWLEADGFLDLVEWLPGAEDRGGVYVTDNAAVTVWQACRRAGIRAASVETCDAVDRAVRELGMNLLVIEPAGKSIALLKQLCGTLRKGGAPRMPEGLERK
jgi:hypothetical protein